MNEWDLMVARQTAADGVRSEFGHHIRTPSPEPERALCPTCGGNGTVASPWYGNCRNRPNHFTTNQGDSNE